MTRFLLVAVVLFLFNNLSDAARADLVLVNVTGAVVNVDAPLLGTYAVGDAMQFSFAYNTATVGSHGVGFSDYQNAISSFALQIGNDAITKTNALNYIRVVNNTPLDEFIIPFIPVNAPPIAGLDPPEFYFGLAAPTTLLPNTNLPSPLPGLSSWSHLQSVHINYNQSGVATHRARIDLSSVASSVAIPEASALVMPGLAVVFLIGRPVRAARRHGWLRRCTPRGAG